MQMARKLLQQNVLVIAMGCGAGALMRHGFMDPVNVDDLCGEGLKAVLNAIGKAKQLGGPLPPVLHMGSCVDNSRAVAHSSGLSLYAALSETPTPKPRIYVEWVAPYRAIPIVCRHCEAAPCMLPA